MPISLKQHHYWQKFKQNRRGYYSLWIFLLIFITVLLSDFIANDKPILLIVDGEVFIPIFEFIPETRLGGFFETQADFTDPFVLQLIHDKGGLMINPPVGYYFDTISQNLSIPAPTPPDGNHWLGTDDQARDVVARLLYGLRVSLIFGFILTIISSVIGVLAGLLQGFYGGWTDLIAQRFIEIWNGLPSLYILIIASAIIQPNFWWLLLIMLLFSWTALVSVVRAEVLRTRHLDYVTAARAMGVSNFRIMLRHILPNALVATMTFLPFIASGSITTLTALDFLGFGLPSGSASLGELLKQGKENLSAPWLGITAFLSLSIMLTLLVFIGEAIRDAFDPHKRR